MAGETALARQLKKLAVPQTTVLIQDKIRKSFLFDHRDAAGLDREVLFAFGTTGLQKLCTTNPMFSKFEKNLFSLSYKDFQRSVQNASVNKKLDSKISEFLRMLSPYFLIRDAHEALEWLIYRFHIHLYNVDDLIASVIPHHNSSTFVRVVQLLDLDEKSRWYWLKPIQKTGVHLEYSAILNRFVTDAGFRKFICDIAPNVSSVYKDHESIAVPVIAFSMSTVYNALEMYKSVEDTHLTFLFPYILNGLLSNLSKYTSASYMVISKIILSVKLTPEIVEDLLIRIFKTLKDDLVEEACAILLLAFQNQSIKVFPKKVLFTILSNPGCGKVLITLVNNFKTIPLIRAIIKKTTFLLFHAVQLCKKNDKSKLLKFFKMFLNNVLLEEKCVLLLFNSTVKRFSRVSQHKNGKKNFKLSKNIAQYIFKFLEHKYPNPFDKAYRKLLGKKSLSNKILLSKLINDAVCSVKYEVIPNIETSLAVGLYHANPEIRQTSVIHLLNLIAKKGFEDKKFIENALYDRLLDKNPDVVCEILSFSDSVSNIVGKPKMLSALKSFFSRPIHLDSDWYVVQMKCLDVVTKLASNDETLYDILEVIINFIFPVNKHTIEGFLHLLNCDLQNGFLLELKGLKTNFSEKEEIARDKYFHANSMVIVCLKSFINGMDTETRIVYASFLNSKIINVRSNSLVLFYFYVMQFMSVMSEDKKDSLLFINDLLQVLKSYFSQSNVKQEKFEILSEECIIKDYVHSFNKKKFPISFIYNVFYKVITGIELDIPYDSWPNVENCYGNSYKILSSLFHFCVLYMNSDNKFLQEYFSVMLSLLISHQLKNVKNTFWFLSTKWLNNSENFLVQYTSICIAIALSKGQNEMYWLLENPMIFFSILKAVANPSPELSHAALTLLSVCLKSVKVCINPLKALAEEIIMKSEEIKTDYRQCFDCVGNWLRVASDHMDAQKTFKKSVVNKELKNKITVLNQILSLVNEKEVSYSIKYFLISCLQNVDNVTILSSCIPVLYSHIILFEKFSEENGEIFKGIQLLIKKYTPKTAVSLTEDSDESKALLYCLNCTINRDNDIDRTIQMLTLDVLNKEFFSSIASVTVQQKILGTLLTLYMTSPLNTEVENVLKELCSYSYLFIKYLQDKELIASKSTTLREAKKSKIQENNPNTFENDTWKKITVILELMQNESNLLKTDILIPELFNLLHKSLDYDNQASVEYIKQLILSAIHSCCEQLSVGAQKKLEQDFRVELIIHCIRSSTNPKTHHQALLLLNLAATMFPDYVLKNVMSIFVFMGSSLVRQDDSYSFQVISQTIETIVPSLLEASNQQTETDGYQVVASVIRVFVDSLLDIPGHRQLPLFTKLITTLNPSKYLWVPLGQICDQYATAFHDITTDDSKNWKVSPTLEFAVNLHKQFSPDIQIDTCINLVNFLQMLPDTKRQVESNPDKYKKIKEPFNVIGHTDKQLQIYKHNVLTYMKIWLSSQAFLSQVSELSVKQQNCLEEKYELLLESVLGFLQERLDINKSGKADLQMNNQVQLLYDLVHAINSLLPCDLFIKVMRRLLKNKEKEIQVRSVELLITKWEQRELLHAENPKSLLKLRRPLLNLVDTCLNEKDKDNKNVVIQQTALYALHLLCKLVGSEYPTKFYKVLNVSVEIISKYDTPELKVNALLCLAQLCSCLNVDILPHLNTFMPIILNILQDKKKFNMNEFLILGVVTALHSIVENLGIFLSSYMEDIIISTCVYSVSYSELGRKAVVEKFVNLQTKLANEISLRVLFCGIENSYSKLSKKNANFIVPLMEILTQSLEASKHEDILACTMQLQQFYISSLDFRNCNLTLSTETIDHVENSIISSLQTFVMKLSVTRFRTFFQKIYQWAVVPSDDQEQKERVFTFYKLTHELSKSLKTLFSAMSRYFFTHTASILSSCNISKSKVYYFSSNMKLSHELLLNVLDTLNYCFIYSEEQLLDKENFDLLMHPLVDQIENLDDEVGYQELIENHLTSCIANFMTAVSDSTLWKALNYQILLKTRHNSPKVRFGSLQVLLEVVNKMGDNYLVLLPESIPFLAEILEDESSEVEQECQSVIIEMEKILGEPIRKYF